MPIISKTTISEESSPQIFTTEYEWSLKDCNYLLLRNNSKTFESPRFYLTRSTQVAYLSFATINEDEVALTLHLLPCTEESVDLIVIATMSDNKGSDEEDDKDDNKDDGTNDKSDDEDEDEGGDEGWSPETTEMEKHVLGTKKIVLQEKIKDIKRYCMKDNTIWFTVTIHNIQKQTNFSNAPPNKELIIMQKIRKFYEEGKFCDVTFVVGENSAHAHSLVLVGACTYFHDQLEGEKGINAENGPKLKKSIVNLTNDSDITFEALQACLDFVYGCTNLKETKVDKCDLLSVARKFGMTELENACVELISKTFDAKNIASILLFACKKNCASLKKEGLQFAKSCLKDVVLSKEFEELRKNQSFMLDLF